MTASLQTDRLLLRGWRETDLEALALFYADEESTRFIGGARNLNGAWRNLAAFAGHWVLKGFGPFAVTLRDNGALAGYCGPWDPAGKAEEPELAYGFLPFARGRGLATEALKVALAYCYEDLGWKTACSFIARENTASINLARRLGAFHEKDGAIYGGSVPCQFWRYPAPDEIQSSIQRNA